MTAHSDLDRFGVIGLYGITTFLRHFRHMKLALTLRHVGTLFLSSYACSARATLRLDLYRLEVAEVKGSLILSLHVMLFLPNGLML